MSGSRQAIPDDRRTLTNQLVRHLRRQIMLGERPPGQHLGEVALTEELGVSRSTVREALRYLRGEYLIETRAHHGSIVASLTPAKAVEACRLHAMLESECFRGLAIPILPEHRRHLLDLTDRMRQLSYPANVNEFIELDHMFHKSIVDMSEHELVGSVWANINSLIGIILTMSIRYIELDSDNVADRHVVIVDALSDPNGSKDRAIAIIDEHYQSLARMFSEKQEEKKG